MWYCPVLYDIVWSCNLYDMVLYPVWTCKVLYVYVYSVWAIIIYDLV